MKSLSDTLDSVKIISRAMLESAMTGARELFKEEGSVSPVIFSANEDESNIRVHEIAVFDDDTKPAVFATMRLLRKTCPATLFITEIWQSKAKQEDVTKDFRVKVMPSDDPDHTESIMITMWQGKRVITINAEITRNPDALGEWKVFYDSEFTEPGGPTDVKGAMMEDHYLEGGE